MAEMTVWQIFLLFSSFWGFIGIILPWFVPKSPSRGLIQCILVETAFCCYLFWLCTFLMQLRPICGPIVNNRTLNIMKREWERDSLKEFNDTIN